MMVTKQIHNTDQLQVPTETGVVERRGVPLVPDVEVHLLALGEIPGE